MRGAGKPGRHSIHTVWIRAPERAMITKTPSQAAQPPPAMPCQPRCSRAPRLRRAGHCARTAHGGRGVRSGPGGQGRRGGRHGGPGGRHRGGLLHTGLFFVPALVVLGIGSVKSVARATLTLAPVTTGRWFPARSWQKHEGALSCPVCVGSSLARAARRGASRSEERRVGEECRTWG